MSQSCLDVRERKHEKYASHRGQRADPFAKMSNIGGTAAQNIHNDGLFSVHLLLLVAWQKLYCIVKTSDAYLMQCRNIMMREDDDEFWKIALSEEQSHSRFPDRDLEEDSNDERKNSGALRPVTYHIPWRNSPESDGNDSSRSDNVLKLRLSPLPDHEGIWSPLGAQAWYASSLLVAYLLQENNFGAEDTQETSILSSYLKAHFFREEDESSDGLISPPIDQFTALELGSGAVGLVGITVGLILAQLGKSRKTDGENKIKGMTNNVPHVIMTDNDPDVVGHLKYNVDNTMLRLQEENKGISLPRFRVEELDWNHYDNNSLLSGQTTKIQLVVGSELVYTNDTAQACAKVVLALLTQHPDALVFILQVVDRDGWTNEFLPTILKHGNFVVKEESIQNSELHDVASSIIPQGGTLDRFAFGACYIFNKANPVADILLSDR